MICPEPGCGREMVKKYGEMRSVIPFEYWPLHPQLVPFCPATPKDHRITALEAENAELRRALDLQHLWPSVVIESVAPHLMPDGRCSRIASVPEWVVNQFQSQLSAAQGKIEEMEAIPPFPEDAIKGSFYPAALERSREMGETFVIAMLTLERDSARNGRQSWMDTCRKCQSENELKDSRIEELEKAGRATVQFPSIAALEVECREKGEVIEHMLGKPWDTSCVWVCEEHPHLLWPHDDCAGPGMPPLNLKSQLSAALDQIAMMGDVMTPLIVISDRKHDVWDAAKVVLASTAQAAQQWRERVEREALEKVLRKLPEHGFTEFTIGTIRAAIHGVFPEEKESDA